MSAIAQFIQRPPERPLVRPLVVCHCTVVHTQLKSRSFHRQLLPLAELGFDVRYVAPILENEPHTGIKVIRLHARPGFFRRLTAWPQLLRALLKQNASVYHFQDPQLLLLAFVLKLVFRKRVVYDAYEDFPSIAASKKSIPRWLRPLAAAGVAFVERLAAHIFDALLTADPITLRRFARNGKSKKLVFYNFPNLDFFPSPRPRSAPFDLVYRGGISERTGSFVLLEALALLKSRPYPARVLLIGYFDHPDDEAAFRERVHALGLEPLVELRGRIDHERMADALSEARIGLSPLLAVPKFEKNIPVKIFEYWACGLPVVATDLAPMRPLFRNYEAGLLVQPGDASSLAEAIAWLLDHPASAHRMGQRGRQLVTDRLNNTRETLKLRRVFERIADQHHGGSVQSCSNLS